MFEPRPCAAQLTGDALANGDDELRRQEHADLAELDLLGRVVVPGRAQDHQLHLAVVGLDLGSHVERLRVLDGEFVQAEALAHPVEFVGRRLEHPQPDEAALLVTGRRLLDRHRANALAASVPVVRAVDDHREPPSARSVLAADYERSPGICSE